MSVGEAPASFVVLVLLVAIGAGATAAIVGFGIGSLLTPLLHTRYGTELAIAAVALPHIVGSCIRGWRLRHFMNEAVLLRFGVLSVACGLIGALLFSRLASAALTPVLGALLVMTGASGVIGWTDRWRPSGPIVWILGALSGFFGGIAGNQGGLRAAALSTFGLSPKAFIATSTVIGLFVDVAVG